MTSHENRYQHTFKKKIKEKLLNRFGLRLWAYATNLNNTWRRIKVTRRIRYSIHKIAICCEILVQVYRSD